MDQLLRRVELEHLMETSEKSEQIDDANNSLEG